MHHFSFYNFPCRACEHSNSWKWIPHLFSLWKDGSQNHKVIFWNIHQMLKKQLFCGTCMHILNRVQLLFTFLNVFYVKYLIQVKRCVCLWFQLMSSWLLCIETKVIIKFNLLKIQRNIFYRMVLTLNFSLEQRCH